jgi:outer membrane protein OmpA-like peptidoglycan-associated protein
MVLDGILDEVDQCVTQAEDHDGFEDDDGCPDRDNDADGRPDVRDMCPMLPEDVDGFEDDDGCPDDDNDADGIRDDEDACPQNSEDVDGFEDEDGCPDPDNDGDDFLDAVDHCPNERETVNGVADDDGCPDSEHALVVGDSIMLDDTIRFTSDQANIQRQSWKMLQSLAKLITDHPEYERIHISGHADQTGESEYNVRLSAARAESVRRLLVEFGVDEARLSTHAFGEDRPRSDGRSAADLQANRRVEFEIVRRDSSKPLPDHWYRHD